MSTKRKPSIYGQFVPLPRDVLESDAWRSTGINERRFIDFLLLEHLRHRGRQNGRLKAPYRQLVRFGIGARLIPDAIRSAEERSLILCNRAGMRAATTYTVTWLPTFKEDDGGKSVEMLPGNEWRAYRCPDSKIRNLHHEGEAGLHHEGEADGLNLHHEGEADGPKTLHHHGDHLSRRSIQEHLTPRAAWVRR